MKKVIAAVLSLMFVLSIAACGEGGESGETGATDKIQAVTGEVVKAELTSGWCIVTSTEMTGAYGEDFICLSVEYQMGDPYLQVVPDSRDIEAVKEMLESEEPYGRYSGETELANGRWYIAEKAAAAIIGEKTVVVKSYECDLSSAAVQSILGSLQPAE